MAAIDQFTISAVWLALALILTVLAYKLKISMALMGITSKNKLIYKERV